VGMVVVVATRMDFFACFYAIWLCKLYNLSRAETVEQWRKLKGFIIAMIPIQYILLVGLPPLLCLDYPWNIPFLKDFREWAMMPENTNEFRNLHWRKLIVDFILLLMICRQTLVFRIEERYKDNDDNFPGGTNKSVLMDIDQMGIVPFENPTPDFIERIR
jgi:piezo-type mechanosensitive ion channel component 1/2